MSLVTCRAAIAKHLRSVFKNTAQVVEHGGAITLEELKRVAPGPVAVVVACLGAPLITTEGRTVVADAAWAVFAVATDDVKEKRDVKALVMAQAVLAEVPWQRWDQQATHAAHDLAASNLYSPTLDATGVSLWAVRWRQKLDLLPNVAAELVDFETFYATWALGGPDTPTTEQDVELPT